MENIERKCPRCKKMYNEYPAISRVDNNTYICSDCGMAEAMDDFMGNPLKDFRDL